MPKIKKLRVEKQIKYTKNSVKKRECLLICLKTQAISMTVSDSVDIDNTH